MLSLFSQMLQYVYENYVSCLASATRFLWLRVVAQTIYCTPSSAIHCRRQPRMCGSVRWNTSARCCMGWSPCSSPSVTCQWCFGECQGCQRCGIWLFSGLLYKSSKIIKCWVHLVLSGRSPLHAAALLSQPEVVELLLASGAEDLPDDQAQVSGEWRWSGSETNTRKAQISFNWHDGESADVSAHNSWNITHCISCCAFVHSAIAWFSQGLDAHSTSNIWNWYL